MVSIPAEIVRRLELEAGDEVEIREEGSQIVVKPKRTMAELLAKWEPLGPPISGEEIAASIREERERRWSS
jgi:AbrB family looped-hinge helix DNA binding protein